MTWLNAAMVAAWGLAGRRGLVAVSCEVDGQPSLVKTAVLGCNTGAGWTAGVWRLVLASMLVLLGCGMSSADPSH